jgi:hypothetical protein
MNLALLYFLFLSWWVAATHQYIERIMMVILRASH